jgi:hypothetical protein
MTASRILAAARSRLSEVAAPSAAAFRKADEDLVKVFQGVFNNVQKNRRSSELVDWMDRLDIKVLTPIQKTLAEAFPGWEARITNLSQGSHDISGGVVLVESEEAEDDETMFDLYISMDGNWNGDLSIYLTVGKVNKKFEFTAKQVRPGILLDALRWANPKLTKLSADNFA